MSRAEGAKGALATFDPFADPETAEEVVRAFTKLYAFSPHRTWMNTFWMGVPVLQTPLDLWVMQEIVAETKPELIVETGTFKGGKAFFLAHVLEALGSGRIVTVDVEDHEEKPPHERITYLVGSSLDDAIVGRIREEAERAERVMVLLDSDHATEHVTKELDIYAELVTPGCYLIVEDTSMDLLPGMDPGPLEALKTFLAENDAFEVDESREKFFMTAHKGGYLRRRTSSAPGN